jgi:hypothetical protein
LLLLLRLRIGIGIGIGIGIASTSTPSTNGGCGTIVTSDPRERILSSRHATKGWSIRRRFVMMMSTTTGASYRNEDAAKG